MEKIKIKPAFADERGSISDLLVNEQIDHIGMLISKKGSIRGKHYHKEQKQYTLVLNGKIRIVTKDVTKVDSEIESMDVDEMEMVLFPPFYYHSLESLEDSKCLIFTSKSRIGNSYEEDTIRIENIESFKLT